MAQLPVLALTRANVQILTVLNPAMLPLRAFVEAFGCFGDFTVLVMIGGEARATFGIADAKGEGNVGLAFSTSGARGCFAGYCAGAQVGTPRNFGDLKGPEAGADIKFCARSHAQQ